MKQILSKNVVIKMSTLLLTVLILAGPLSATVSARHSGTETEDYAHTTSSEHTESNTENSRLDDSSHSSGSGNNAAERLKEVAKKAEQKMKSSALGTMPETRRCERRQAVIAKVIQKIALRAQQHLTKFSNTQTRIVEFKTTKNLTVANYEALLSDADAKKISATLAIGSIDTTANLKCSGGTQTAGQAIKTQIQTAHLALKTYRTAVKNLLKAVKQANRATASSNSGVQN